MSNPAPQSSNLIIPASEGPAQNGPAGVFSPTPLSNALGESSPLQRMDYRGATTFTAFASATQELAAMLTGSGVFDLGWRGFLRCVGEDRVRWLNGMVTNSVVGLSAGQGCYAFVLNAQGRIQGDLSIYRTDDALWLQTDQSQIGPLTSFLERYIIMDDVTLERAEEWTALGIAGPHAGKVLSAAGFAVAELMPMHLKEQSWNGHRTIVLASHGPVVPRYEIWCLPDDVLEVWNALIHAGAARCGAEAVEQLRIVEGTLAYAVDITDRDLPQETGQTRALHFSKGCYLGQEIVERIRSRGNVHRTVSGFVVQENFAVPRPHVRVALMAEDKSVGEISSIARIALPGSVERVLALGSIRREALERKTPLATDGCVVTPTSLPFDFAPSKVQP